MSSFAKLTRYVDGQLVSGALAVAAVAGQFVSIKDPAAATGIKAVNDLPQFELATGKRGYSLLRDVLNQSERTLDEMIRQEAGFLSPVLVNEQVTARDMLREGEYEGASFLTLTGAQALSTSTPLRSLLTFLNGKLALRTAGTIEIEAAGHSGAGAVTVAGTRVGDAVTNVIQTSDMELAMTGHNGAGACTLTGVLIGDIVERVLKADGTDVTSSFEAVVTVNGQLQQSSASDFSAVKHTVFLKGPASSASLFEAAVTVAGEVQQSSAADLSGRSFLFIVGTPTTSQEATARLVGFLEPEDSDNTVRIVVEFIN